MRWTLRRARGDVWHRDSLRRQTAWLCLIMRSDRSRGRLRLGLLKALFRLDDYDKVVWKVAGALGVSQKFTVVPVTRDSGNLHDVPFQEAQIALGLAGPAVLGLNLERQFNLGHVEL